MERITLSLTAPVHVWQAARACSPCLETAPCPYGTACGAPLAKTELLRSLVAVLTSARNGETPGDADSRPALPPLPADLQLWRTRVDALGALPLLLTGNDSLAAQRAEVRAFLAARLHVTTEARGEATPPGNMEDWLYNDADWMLPPGRYC